VPVWKLSELLNSEDVVEMRRHLADETLNGESTAVLDLATDRPSLTPTADLMSKLLQVPKEEADEVHRDHES
jgi:hypothetical protein